jgi:xanthine dehydrogenase accessory factor
VPDRSVVIRGGGDLGSGVALRLRRCGFRVTVLEIQRPVAVRRTVAFSEAVYEGCWRVEEVNGVLVGSAAEAAELAAPGVVPVLVDPDAVSLETIRPDVLVDAVMAKRNVGTSRGMAPLVVALGPGFNAGVDVDAVVETNRGPFLGRVVWRGPAEPNTGNPGTVHGRSAERVLRAPTDGIFAALAPIAAVVERDQPLAEVGGDLIVAPFRGLLRGLLRSDLPVTAGMKVGDIDPRLDPRLCRYVSDKALAIAGGVLEAILMVWTIPTRK